MVNKDRVRKSSGCTEGVVNVETDWAADLIARRDAVRFDLKDDLKLGNVREDAVRSEGTVSWMVASGRLSNTWISQSSKSVSSRG
jgi:hypothetical protein